MRIVSGKWRGTKLNFPKNKSFRPTQDRVKESIFNILGQQCDDLKVLDLCCGTGGLGFEAASRGAKEVTLIDHHTDMARMNNRHIMDRVDTLCPWPIRIIQSDVMRFLKKTPHNSYDIILFDPPWDDGDLYESALNAIYHSDILKNGGRLCVIHAYLLPRESMVLWSEISTHKYGKAIVSLLKKQDLS